MERTHGSLSARGRDGILVNSVLIFSGLSWGVKGLGFRVGRVPVEVHEFSSLVLEPDIQRKRPLPTPTLFSVKVWRGVCQNNSLSVIFHADEFTREWCDTCPCVVTSMFVTVNESLVVDAACLCAPSCGDQACHLSLSR